MLAVRNTLAVLLAMGLVLAAAAVGGGRPRERPKIDALPRFDLDFHPVPARTNALGAKGCGEAGAIASPPAVINAITDALGHEDLAMPATAQAVWRAAQKTAQYWGPAQMVRPQTTPKNSSTNSSPRGL